MRAKSSHLGKPRRIAGRADTPQQRRQVVVEAARIMAEEGVQDFHTAKRKALERLALPPTRNLPSNEEIASALTEHLQLFHGERLSHTLRNLRLLALEAMHFLAPFEPRLVGPVLSGTVTPESEIQIHLVADTPEDVALFLQEHGIPFQLGERRLRFGGDRYQSFPAYRFTTDNIIVELNVFNPRTAREVPLSPVDGRPMKRANAKEIEQLTTRS